MNQFLKRAAANARLLWPPHRAPNNCFTALARTRFVKHHHRAAVSNLLSKFYPKSNHSAKNSGEESALRSQGIVTLDDVVSETQALKIRQWAMGSSFFDPFRKDAYQLLSYPPAPDFKGSHGYVAGNLIKDCPGLLDVISHPRVLGSIESYFGCKPTLANVLLQWTFMDRGGPRYDQLFHRDLDDWRFVKFFVYLGDILESQDGPHVYVVESHHDSAFLHTDGTFQDSEIQRYYSPEKLVPIYGRAGTCFIADTFGVHRGLPPLSKDRLVVTAVYSLHSYSYFFKYPPTISRAELDCCHPLDPYIFRLYVK